MSVKEKPILKEIPEGYMKDSQGRLVPADMVNAIDKDRDNVVRDIIREAAAISETITQFKERTITNIEKFIKKSGKQYNVKIGGIKGNLTILSYDGEYKVCIAVSENFIFDERLQIAKELVDQCIQEWGAGNNENIMILVNEAFQVDKQGKINVKRILGLRKLNIKDSKWQKAMKAINDSLGTSGSKRYMRMYQRNNEGEYDQISLNLSAL